MPALETACQEGALCFYGGGQISTAGHTAVPGVLMAVLSPSQDSDLTATLKDGDIDGLAAQNAYLKDALEACRTQIFELTQQVG